MIYGRGLYKRPDRPATMENRQRQETYMVLPRGPGMRKPPAPPRRMHRPPLASSPSLRSFTPQAALLLLLFGSSSCSRFCGSNHQPPAGNAHASASSPGSSGTTTQVASPPPRKPIHTEPRRKWGSGEDAGEPGGFRGCPLSGASSVSKLQTPREPRHQVSTGLGAHLRPWLGSKVLWGFWGSGKHGSLPSTEKRELRAPPVHGALPQLWGRSGWRDALESSLPLLCWPVGWRCGEQGGASSLVLRLSGGQVRHAVSTLPMLLDEGNPWILPPTMLYDPFLPRLHLLQLAPGPRQMCHPPAGPLMTRGISHCCFPQS